MESFEFLIRLFEGEPGRKKVLAIIISLILIVSALIVYEGITATFTLSRLQKSADLISKLQEIDAAIKTNGNPALLASYKELEREATNTISMAPLPIEVSSYLRKMAGKDLIWKFIAGSALFWSFGLLVIFRVVSNRSQDQNEMPKKFWNVSKATAQACFFYGFFAIWLPKVFWPFNWWPLFHIFICPILATMALLIVTALFIKPETDLAPHDQTAKKGE